MDLVVHGIDTGVRQTADADDDDDEVKNRAITEDGEEAWEGTKGRYCSGKKWRKFRCCPWVIVIYILLVAILWLVEVS